MKSLAFICSFLVSVNWLFAASGPAEAAIIYGGKRFVYTDHVLRAQGRASQHFVVVHEDSAAFTDAFIRFRQGKPQRPGIPYLSLGPVTFPLGRPGVYLVTLAGDGAEVELLNVGAPKKEDQASIEALIMAAMKEARSGATE